ncbi:FAD-dependent oxidoreductase [Glycomyces sp. NPDC046736]|uniref:NAD(P)/FAD-dependent oxidoreductase n=1 Tax=Glycomyces sp. NPDC046736 TaxID=3155615 RepID=UPI003407A3F7
MGHRILVLGAGYAGLTAARRLSTLLRGTDAAIVLVNDRTDFVERLRLHQVAAGQDLPRYDLAELLRGSGVRLHCARVEAVDPKRRTVLADDDTLAYDSLVYALGSAGATMPGSFEHAWNASSPPSAMRLRDKIARVESGGRVLVVGGGLTGLEIATEIAQARPDAAVALATSGGLGDWLVPGARAHLRRGCERLGVTVNEGVRVERFTADGAVTEEGKVLDADVAISATGFAPGPIAAASGLRTEAGLIVVDEAMRSVSHPEVYAIGDAALAAGPGGKALRMSCSSGMPTGWLAAGHIAAAVAARRPPRLKVRYFHQTISLGRRDAVVQFVTADDRPRSGYLTGRAAARYKESLCRIAMWSFAHDLPKGRTAA